MTGPAAVTVRVIREMGELSAIARQWDDLVLGVLGRLPMLSYAWLSSFLELRQGEDLPWLCLAAFCDGRLAGVFVLEVCQASMLGLPITCLRPPFDTHTRSVDAVLAPGLEAEVMRAFREALDREVPGWFELHLEGVEGSSFAAAREGGMPGTVRLTPYGGSASVVETTGDWEEYHKRLSSNFRRHLKKSRKKLADLGGGRTEFLVGAEAAPGFLDEFNRIEAAGWKGRAGSAIRTAEGLEKFYWALTGRLHERGVLEWHFLRVGDRAIAGHMAVKTGRELVIWKIGYDEEFAACSPGVVLMEEALRRAFADPATEGVNFVTDKEWHNSWLPVKRAYADVTIFPARPLPLAAGVLPQRAKLLLRRVPGAVPMVAAVRRWLGPGENRRAEGSAEANSTSPKR